MVALGDFLDVLRDAIWLSNLSARSEAVLFLDDVPRAKLLYKLLLPYADRHVTIPALLGLGSAARAFGLLATTLSRFEDAERHFERALTMNAQIKPRSLPTSVVCTRPNPASTSSRCSTVASRCGSSSKRASIYARRGSRQLGAGARTDRGPAKYF
jgi:hypothetical protein